MQKWFFDLSSACSSWLRGSIYPVKQKLYAFSRKNLQVVRNDSSSEQQDFGVIWGSTWTSCLPGKRWSLLVRSIIGILKPKLGLFWSRRLPKNTFFLQLIRLNTIDFVPLALSEEADVTEIKEFLDFWISYCAVPSSINFSKILTWFTSRDLNDAINPIYSTMSERTQVQVAYECNYFHEATRCSEAPDWVKAPSATPLANDQLQSRTNFFCSHP